MILASVSPKEIADVPLPNTYGPFLGMCFLASFFLLGYLLRSARRGVFAALAISLLIFFRLQHVVVGKYEVIGLLGFFSILEIFILIRKNKQNMT